MDNSIDIQEQSFIQVHQYMSPVPKNRAIVIRALEPDPSESTYCKVISTILVSATPIFFSLIAIFMERVVILFLLNKANNDETVIAATGLGSAWLTLISISLFLSLNVGLTTRTSQAYGAKQFETIGLLFHRALIINGILLIPCIGLLMYAESAFSVFDFEPRLANLTSKYLIACVPGVVMFVVFATIASVLNGCERFKIPGAIQVIAAFSYWIAAYIFIIVFKLGIVGVALGFNIMWAIALAIVIMYLRKKNPLPTVFFWPKKESYKGIWTLFKYEMIIGSMTWVDFISWELMVMLTGSLPTAQQAGFTIGGSVYRLQYPLTFSVALTTMAFSGNAMGEGNKRKAMRFIKSGITFALIGIFVFEMVFHIHGNRILSVFTSDKESLHYARGVLTMYMIMYPGDALQMVLSNAIKGIGKERSGVKIIVLCDYIIAIPTSYLCCFVFGMGIKGITVGYICSEFIKSFLYGRIIWRVDWEKQMKEISDALSNKKRDKKDKKGSHDKKKPSKHEKKKDKISLRKADENDNDLDITS